MKVFINEAYINSTNKEGKPYKDKNNKPYTRITIVVEGKKYSFLSYNENDAEREIQKGQTVDIVTEKNGDFYNFRLFNRAKTLERLAYFEDMVAKLKACLS